MQQQATTKQPEKAREKERVSSISPAAMNNLKERSNTSLNSLGGSSVAASLANPSLPPGWEADFDEETGKVFYIDHNR